METPSSLHRKIIEKERERRDAEFNLKHLANRLKILESEEQKVYLAITQ
jgi:hypothetical protein